MEKKINVAELLKDCPKGMELDCTAYDVSKSLIIMVCNPDIAERKRIASMERHREGRYTPTKEEWAATMREHRRYKHQLYKEGKI